MVSLEGRTIVVTGAAQGIGKATSELAVALGARVVAVDLNQAGLDALAQALGKNVATYAGDVSDPKFVQGAIDDVSTRFGVVHGLVNNAGIIRPAMIEKMTLQQWNEVIAVHLTGAFLWTQAVGRRMIEAANAGGFAGGSIINISSVAGRGGSIGQINYAAAKAGLLGMTMSIAKEWARYNIRANSVCFGVVETPMTETIRGEKFRDGVLSRIPMGRWAQTDEVVKPICFLLSDAASYITGQHVPVDGGYLITV
ncbi:MAG: SDR family oxidoreductase [Hyphomicrobiales bacterium]|nr:SDR family oxidoreductase [Hyphomicrobiales bacterium]